jgi:hypothetical protein
MRSLFLATLALASIAFAGTTSLPDPAISVNLASGYTTVTIAGKAYRGVSQFVYFSECAKPDVPYKYRCDIVVESGVVLVAADGSAAVVNITAQFASTLITSGHNYWRQSQIVLAGDVTI